MRLAEFIKVHSDTIVAQAAQYARTLAPLAHESESTLRDHIPKILQAIVLDLENRQSPGEAHAKSLGQGAAATGTADSAAQTHGRLRARSGLQMAQLVAEYRALRAGVLRLWSEEEPVAISVSEVIRFNEAIDQAVAESVEFFSAETDQLRNVFLGVLGHDLRGPLNAILLTAELISRKTKDSPLSEVGVLIRSGRRMSSLLDTLLQYNRSALGGGMSIHRGLTDLGKECAAEIELLRAALPHARIDFSVEGDTEGLFDASAVREALGNLVNNAATYGDDGPISVTLTDTVDTVLLKVANTGKEIPSSEIPKLFQALQRGTAAHLSESRTSLGLGLFIVQQIATAHGGQIQCASSAAGTTFELVLPREVAPLPGR
ncbi:signal transduction histidine kinase [Variovorax boronicumulans]|uniref:sensor histidine kinase n=1 Tax=Variovorax TaxID=34072 RepID=UPI00277DB294|nr:MULTISPECIES: sensor histidine kinase [Variovorax]MDQ0035025.1 signal transduction histidine kinase [Variovorax boronicumulans]MDQ0609047.1 signal transduction histidine kinase [Variovorax sp. W1I1]